MSGMPGSMNLGAAISKEAGVAADDAPRDDERSSGYSRFRDDRRRDDYGRRDDGYGRRDDGFRRSYNDRDGYRRRDDYSRRDDDGYAR